MIPEILVFSKRIWEELSEEDRELIMSLTKAQQRASRELWYAMEEEAAADMKANGVEVIDVGGQGAFRQAVPAGLGEARGAVRRADRSDPGRPMAHSAGPGAERPAGSRRTQRAATVPRPATSARWTCCTASACSSPASAWS